MPPTPPSSFAAGILGAGLGSRLRGVSACKPLAEVAGETLLGRTSRLLRENGASPVICALRDELLPLEARAHLPEGPTYIFVNTESSLHTLAEVAKALPQPWPAHVFFTMADTVLSPGDFRDFLAFCRGLQPAECGILATRFIDDENPLYVHANEEGRVLRFGGSDRSPIVTSGMYCLSSSALALVAPEVARGTKKMRNFLGLLASRGMAIKSFVVEKTVDVDHPMDLAQAETLLGG
ncbi:MAG: NTP transferase domain-containing protein [Bdellovibrionales bacterium]|nr:NTP transferase domain-containing protein [Bdellovibrionales bacterium]